MGLRLAVGIAAALTVGLFAWRLRWLRADGAWAAGIVGAAVFGFTGWPGAVALLLFFVTSTLLGRLPGRGAGRRHGARDARQVVANGGVAGLAAILAALGIPWALAALVGALAAANADTWATEIGTRWGGVPRAFGFGSPLAGGESGGMSPVGTVGGLAGAGVIAIVAGGWAAALGGVCGLLADSLLGATLQAVYRCPDCGARVETTIHDPCCTPARLVRGIGWLDNDAVNLVATLVGAAVAAMVVHAP